MSGETGETVLVVGAGIVGICCALHLQQAGFQVTVIDRDEPGSNTSFGAAGNFGGNAHFAIPGIMWKLPRMLLNPLHPFAMRFRDAPELLPWFRRYMECAAPDRAAAIARAAMALGEGVYDRYVALLTEAGEPGLITRRGRLFVWTTDAGFQRDQYGLEHRRKQGIALQLLSGDQVREMEPAIGPSVRHGAYAEDAGHILNPFRLVQVLANHFRRKGGRILREEVRAIRLTAEGAPVVETSQAAHEADQAVLAAGIWSRELAARLGSQIPMVAERGYHTMLENPGIAAKISTLWEERKVIFTPMEHGLRASGIAEFAAPGAPPRWRFAERLRQAAIALFPGLNANETSRWMGRRPVTPDYLPVIGRAPRHPRVIFAFGHGHSGFHLGPATGSLVAQIAAGRTPNIDIAPYRAERWPGRLT